MAAFNLIFGEQYAYILSLVSQWILIYFNATFESNPLETNFAVQSGLEISEKCKMNSNKKSFAASNRQSSECIETQRKSEFESEMTELRTHYVWRKRAPVFIPPKVKVKKFQFWHWP